MPFKITARILCQRYLMNMFWGLAEFLFQNVCSMYGLMFADKMCLYLFSRFICSLVTCLFFSYVFLSENENVVQRWRGWNEKLFHSLPSVLSKLLLLGVSGLLKSSFRAWFSRFSQASRNSVLKLSASFLLVHLSKMFFCLHLFSDDVIIETIAAAFYH
jgi:hypothetical protein